MLFEVVVGVVEEGGTVLMAEGGAVKGEGLWPGGVGVVGWLSVDVMMLRAMWT